jgi:Domain of unknown function DUF11
VSFHPLRRLVTVASSAILVLMLLGAGITTASTPGWAFTVPQVLPDTVNPGANAGYSFTIFNGGKSNISQLYLTDSINASPVYFSNSRGTTCQLSPTLFCAFGALNAGDTIDVVIAYTTPTSGTSFPVTFELNGTGVSFTDPHKSHGDTLPLTLTTTLNASPNFAGAFELTGTTIGTTGTLGKKNDQTSSVNPKAGSTLVPVTIQDGLTSPPSGGTDPCTTTLNCIGDWTAIRVGNGTNADGPIMVTLLLYGPSVPKGATVDNIGLWHEGSTTNPIVLRCSASTLPTVGGAECVTVTKIGNNFQIVAWLLHNGSLRGQY